MREGSVDYFLGHQIVRDVKDLKYYVYAPDGGIIGVAQSKPEAEDIIMETKFGTQFTHLRHEGVEILKYEYEERVYVLSVLLSIFQKYPYFRTIPYADLIWARDWSKYLHNEHGPANLNLSSGDKKYFWKGEELPESDWQSKVRQKNFRGAVEEIMDEIV